MKILCNGCSFTYGDGFLDTERQSKIWPTLLGKKLGQHAVIENLAYSGSSNLEIFLRTLRAINCNDYDLIAVQWTSLRRHWFEPGIDRYYICAGASGDFLEDWFHKSIYLTKPERKKFFDILTMLTGDFKSVIDLGTFCQTMILLKKPNQQLVFINGLVPWRKDIVGPLEPKTDLDKHFSQFTKDTLEFDDHSDADILKNHNKLRQMLEPTLPYWVNFSEPWNSKIIDLATQGHHPGPLSHAWMANKVFDFVKIDK